MVRFSAGAASEGATLASGPVTTPDESAAAVELPEAELKGEMRLDGECETSAATPETEFEGAAGALAASA